MEIKIGATDMLKVLVNAGIDATDAKAIIFDLIQYPENGGGLHERKKLKDVKKSRLKRKRDESEVFEDEDEDEDGDDEDDGDAGTSIEDVSRNIPRTEIKRPRKISFRDFGGPANNTY
jgi:hypothetical protein